VEKEKPAQQQPHAKEETTNEDHANCKIVADPNLGPLKAKNQAGRQAGNEAGADCTHQPHVEFTRAAEWLSQRAMQSRFPGISNCIIHDRATLRQASPLFFFFFFFQLSIPRLSNPRISQTLHQ